MYQLQSFQIDLHEVAQEIENNSPPVEILRSLVQSTESLQHNGSTDQSLADELSSEEDLANVSSLFWDLNLMFVKGMVLCFIICHTCRNSCRCCVMMFLSDSRINRANRKEYTLLFYFSPSDLSLNECQVDYHSGFSSRQTSRFYRIVHFTHSSLF